MPTMKKPATVIESPVRQWRQLPDGTLVQRSNLIGTDILVYTAWRAAKPWGDYTTITHYEGQCLGEVGTERLPSELDALPAYSDERYQRVQIWQNDRYAAAHELIITAFPEAAEGQKTMMDIWRGLAGVGDQARYENWRALLAERKARRQELAEVR